MAADSRVIIIGGGISGLATAYFLSRAGIRSSIVEKSAHLGGLIQTDHIQGCLLEAGPDSFIATKPAAAELASELGDLASQIIGSNDARRRIFIVRHGHLVPMPTGMAMMIPGQWKPLLTSKLIGLRTKERFLRETLTSPRSRSEDVSVGQLVEDHFGKEAVDYLTEPLLAGVYGGDSAALSAKSVLPRFVEYEEKYGSLIRGVRNEQRQRGKGGSLFLSFQNGMQSLTDCLAQHVSPWADVVRTEATSVERSREGWTVETSGGSESAAHVVLACPAHASAALLESAAPDLAARLSEIPYSSAILVTFVYERSTLRVPLDGFGFLVPRRERRTIAAATWIGTKFPSRIPDDLAAIRTFIVGSEAMELAGVDQTTVAALVRDDLNRVMQVREDPVFTTFHAWPNSMPQYVVGHGRRIQAIQQELSGFAGLHLTGNAYDGIGVPDCIRLAKETAKRISDETERPDLLPRSSHR